MMNCVSCGSSNTTQVETYKRVWTFCHACGDATPVQKERYAFEFLPDSWLKKMKTDEASTYDYFVLPDHIEYSRWTADEFLRRYVDEVGLELSGREVLDISGGNGHFLMELAKRGAKVALTEINQASLGYVRQTHHIDAYEFNFNKQRLTEVVVQPYDYILARAAIMFCADLRQFADDVRARLKTGGIFIINHSVIPTLGVMLRVQLDEFSYWILRQPENVINLVEESGFKCLHRFDETDPSMYVYDNDKVKYWRWMHVLYGARGAKKLMDAEFAGKPGFAFRARDRRRSTMIFRAV